MGGGEAIKLSDLPVSALAAIWLFTSFEAVCAADGSAAEIPAAATPAPTFLKKSLLFDFTGPSFQ
jgi:hypothetical protein